MPEPLKILCLASYFKGDRFLKKADQLGAKVYLFTQQKLLDRPWPREALADIFAQPDDSPLQSTINTVSYLMRSTRFDRIVPLDDFDVETAAALREHFRMPGMGDTTARHFRDKLAMRMKAKDESIPIPDFVGVFNDQEIHDFISRVPAPWMLKPRSEASATGITKIESTEQLWAELAAKGDRRSYFVLEEYLPGDVYHVDSIVSEKEILFAEVHQCGTPPFNVAHGGGIFTSRTVKRGSKEEKDLKSLNQKVLTKFGLVRGVSHVEFIKGRDNGKFHLLEGAARVGGAHIADMVEASTGINLWEEWAKIEIAGGKKPYSVPSARAEYGGLAICLAREERPDLSGYDDPEVVYRAEEKQHAGLVLRSTKHERIKELLDRYQERFARDFLAFMPSGERPSH